MLYKPYLQTALSPSGIEIFGDIPWGSHFCCFYDSKQDLLDILVPYFEAGLDNNEYCLWITSDLINVSNAAASLKKSIPDIDNLLSVQKMEILSHSDWYLKGGAFDPDGAKSLWDAKLEHALAKGYSGMRVNCIASWLNREIWKNFLDHEKEINEQIKNKRIIALCAYPLEMCDALDILDSVQIYDKAITMRHGTWSILEAPVLKESKAKFIKDNEELSNRVNESSRQLEISNINLSSEIIKNEITEAALQYSEANLKGLFKNTDSALILLDTSLNLIMFNPKAKKLAQNGFGSMYRIGENIENLIFEEFRDNFVNSCKKVLNGESVVYELNYPLMDISDSWYHTVMYPIRIDGGRNVGIGISAVDITERVKAAEEKEKFTRDLLHRNKDLEQFSYMVSHNLRAPVANIIGFSKMLSESKYDEENRTVFIEQIKISAGLLDEAIRDLNKILQVKSELRFKKEEVQFSSLVETIKTSLQNIIEKEKTAIITDFKEAKSVMSDRAYLYSIFLNLITNSIKYHQPGKPARIEISTQNEGDSLLIRFKDNGIGINLKKYRKKVFGVYERFHPEIEGKGLGLFMVKTQVQILGGDIHLESEVNKGSQFIIKLKK
jgi:PAS domain S-box-containing protein